MNSEKLQQLQDEITQKMIEGLQNQDFDKLLEKYDVLNQAKLVFQFTLNLDADESIQSCGVHMPCPIDPNLPMCYCCC